MKLNSLGQLPQKPWKNGQGMTTEIAIEPPGANFSEENFQWRISCAEVRGSNAFSLFKGYDRLLLVWNGDGLLLNGKKLDPFVPYQFSGEDNINCKLVSSEVIDLGVIFQKNHINCEMKVLSGNNGDHNPINLTAGQKSFLFLADGAIQVQGINLKSGDFLEFESESKAEIKYLAKSRCIQINLMKSIP